MLHVGNGDFETGHTSWYESLSGYRYQYDGLITNDPIVKSRSGNYYAWFGGANASSPLINATSIISQTVSVPANAPFLRIYYVATSESVCVKSGINYADYAQVLANDVLLTKIELCDKKSVMTWTPLTFDLTKYKNQSLVITLKTSNDSALVSSFLVDDIGFVPSANFVLSYYGRANTQAPLSALKNALRPTATP